MTNLRNSIPSYVYGKYSANDADEIIKKAEELFTAKFSNESAIYELKDSSGYPTIDLCYKNAMELLATRKEIKELLGC